MDDMYLSLGSATLFVILVAGIVYAIVMAVLRVIR